MPRFSVSAIENYGDGGAGSEFNPILIQLALVCTIIGSCISLFSVWLHWKNYRKPVSENRTEIAYYFIDTLLESTTTSNPHLVDGPCLWH